MHAETQAEAIRFVLDLGQALQRYGTPAHRLEDTMQGAASRLGLEAQFFTTPTAIMATFEGHPAPYTTLIRVDSGEVDLAKVTRLDRLGDSVVQGKISPQRGRMILHRLVEARRPYDAGLMILAFGLVSGAAARFFGGGAPEMITSAVIGLLTGALAKSMGRTVVGARAFELIAAFLASTLALQASRLSGQVSPEIATLAGLIALVPGLTLTTALSELATRNLVSGSARMTAAVIVFLQIAFGVALALKLDAVLFGALPAAQTSEALSRWSEPAALWIASFGLALLFRAPRPLVPWVMGAGLISFAGARLGAQILGPELGVALGAFAVGVAGNTFARWRQRPALVLIVPGILLLVPGSLGFRSVNMLLKSDTIGGLNAGFSTLLAGISIVAGLLMANLAVSPRRAL